MASHDLDSSPSGVDGSSSVSDLVVALRQRIASHDIPPGTRLREQHLAEEFGVPRPRVREALLALGERGLIERIPNRGAVVARMSVEQLLDIYDVREVLEGLCARLATERAPAGYWDDLSALFGDPMERCVANEDFDGFVEGYEQFRQSIIDAAANPVLSDLLNTIHDKTQVAIRRIIILPGRAEVGLAEHRDVLAAITSGDAESAERLRRLNMRSARDFLVRYKSFVL